MTRTAILLWSAASGFIVGLLMGILLLAAVTLIVNILPVLSDRVVGRARTPVLVVLLLVVPLLCALLGYLEGRNKLS